MTYSTNPAHIEQFRDATANHQKMAGATFVTFLCPDCGKCKSVRGRKSRGYKAGFRCADCAGKGNNK